MVADDEVDSFALGISNLLNCFDAAVKHDDEFHTNALGIVYALH